MNQKIWISPPHISGYEQKHIQEVFESNWISTVGPSIDAFENDIKIYLNEPKEVVALNSGTSAIHLALIQAGVQKDDIVIAQSFTFAATVNPIVYLGAFPVFIDSEIDTWNMCPELLEEAIIDLISKGKKPKAIIVVDLYGMPAKLDEIQEIAKKYNIFLIEDAAEALGAKYKGKKCGSFGDFGVLSFNGNKIITTSCGGALICNTTKEKRKVVYLATQARDNSFYYQHSEIGYNYRMSNICAGIGRGQMEVLDQRVEARRRNFEFYNLELSSFSGVAFLKEPKELYSNRWLTCIVFESNEIREKVRLLLENENIESRPLWKPMHTQPVFKDYQSYVNGVADNLSKKGLCLPSGSNLSEEDITRIVAIIKKHVK